ncbi:PAS domain S-box protein [Flavihumibacter sp. RY-1]|uniref:histidine kinase n=1 Tax=Flavihumibacter fluminis TaxID=2909236 RepID=A0ABS9BGJ9_9BACT|nr:PAS domain S-box protein [Flavihumibacter fluminis]MCF1714304.1 PAS domain S-box protein [Flavihumibacter fluminis]
MKPGFVFHKGYLLLVGSIILIALGANIYFKNRQNQPAISRQLVANEQKSRALLELDMLQLKALRDKRGFQINQADYMLSSYQEIKKESFTLIGQIEDQFQEDTLLGRVNELLQVTKKRFEDWDQQLNAIANLSPEAAQKKLAENYQANKHLAEQWEAQFGTIQTMLTDRNKELSKRFEELISENNRSFILLLLLAVGLLSLSFFAIRKQDSLQQEHEATLKINKAVRASQQEFSSAFEYASIGMALVSLDGKFTRVNSSLCKLLGYTAEELKGMTFQEITHPDDLDTDLEYVKQMLSGEIDSYSMEKRYFHKDGSIIWINLSGSKVKDAEGKPLYFIAQIENITEWKKVQTELVQQKDRISNILEGTHAGTWEWNVKTGETRFNEVWAELIGYTLEELQPINIDTWSKYVHPDDLAESDRRLKACFNREVDFYECEGRMKHKDGHYVWVLDRGKVMSWTADGKPLWMSGTHLDISQSKQLELQLAENEAKIRGIFNSTFQFIGFLKLDGELMEANQTALDFAGITVNDVKGKKFWDCYWWQKDEQTKIDLQHAITRAAAGETVVYEVEVLGLNKQISTILFSLKPLFDASGKVVAIIPEGRPIDEIVQARHLLEQKNEELEQFASIAAHDLKEPLRMVGNFMSLLKAKHSSQLDSTALKYVDFAINGSQRMSQLINDLLDYAKVGSEQVPFDSIDPEPMLLDILSLNDSLITEKGVKISWSNLPNFRGQQTAIKLLFQNLIMNGIKYQEPDNAPVIHITGKELADCWLFSVEDNGIGIPAQYHEKIFQVFSRLHSKDKYGGTGMGLATCKKIVTIHGGRIWVESKEGEGSCFHFTISKSV